MMLKGIRAMEEDRKLIIAFEHIHPLLPFNDCAKWAFQSFKINCIIIPAANMYTFNYA